MNKSILIVEDEILPAISLRDFLLLRRYENVKIAKNYDEAIDLLDHNQFDVVVLDVFLLGKKTGVDVAKYIRKKEIDTKIIYTSAISFMSQLRDEMDETNPLHIINKPYSLEVLFRAIQKA